MQGSIVLGAEHLGAAKLLSKLVRGQLLDGDAGKVQYEVRVDSMDAVVR